MALQVQILWQAKCCVNFTVPVGAALCEPRYADLFAGKVVLCEPWGVQVALCVNLEVQSSWPSQCSCSCALSISLFFSESHSIAFSESQFLSRSRSLALSPSHPLALELALSLSLSRALALALARSCVCVCAHPCFQGPYSSYSYYSPQPLVQNTCTMR